MTLAYKARAEERLLAKQGEEALLRGAPAGKVFIAHGVEMSKGDPGRSDDNHIVHVSICTILSQYASKTGDILVHPDGTFRLDRLFKDSGYTRKHIVVKA